MRQVSFVTHYAMAALGVVWAGGLVISGLILLFWAERPPDWSGDPVLWFGVTLIAAGQFVFIAVGAEPFLTQRTEALTRGILVLASAAFSVCFAVSCAVLLLG